MTTRAGKAGYKSVGGAGISGVVLDSTLNYPGASGGENHRATAPDSLTMEGEIGSQEESGDEGRKKPDCYKGESIPESTI